MKRDNEGAVAASPAAKVEKYGGPTGRKLTVQQLEVAAMLLAQGQHQTEVAKQLACSPQTIAARLKDKKFQVLVDGYRDKETTARAKHTHTLLEMLDTANTVIFESLRSHDDRLARDTALQVWDRLGLDKAQTQQSESSGGTPGAHIEVGKVLVQIGENLGSVLREAFDADPKRHTLEGEAALPQALLEEERANVRRAENSAESEILDIAFSHDDEVPSGE